MSWTTAPSIDINDLTYTFPNGTVGLKDVAASLPPGSRTILIGANGAGKSTLLKLAAGKTLAKDGSIRIGGVDPFKEGLEGVTYLGLDFVLNPVVRTDIGVNELLHSVGGTYYPERRDELISILDIDTDWRMHAISDGERRRVQLAMGLLRPWSILLLDEITVDLDCLARAQFLEWLKEETQKRPCTVMYATHITDGLSGWPTHLVRMTLGRVREFGTIESFFPATTKQEVVPSTGGALTRNSALLELVLGWLASDMKERGPRKSTLNRLAAEKEKTQTNGTK